MSELESELHASQLNLQSMYMHSHTEPTQYQEQVCSKNRRIYTVMPFCPRSKISLR